MVLKFIWLDDKLSPFLLLSSFGGLEKLLHDGVLDERFANQLHNVDLIFDSLKALQSDCIVLFVAAFIQG